jgi:ribonuclease HIII
MKMIPNQTWKLKNAGHSVRIKEWLLSYGGEEDSKITNPYEAWRVRFSDATVTFYKKGTLYVTDSDDIAIVNFHQFVNSLAGSKFAVPTRQFLIGCDEAGKGEVFGHTVLAGVVFPKEICSELERDIGSANSKIKHDVEYWDDVFRKIESYKARGLDFVIEKIPPWESDKFNVNRLFDMKYQTVLKTLLEKVSPGEVRIVVDDYGTGVNLNQYLSSLRSDGAEVVKVSGADDKYLETRVASLIAKREQQKALSAVSKNGEFSLPGQFLGSGNAGDPKTVEWLKAWKKTGKEWPWFVKRSFENIRKIDGLPGKAEKS